MTCHLPPRFHSAAPAAGANRQAPITAIARKFMADPCSSWTDAALLEENAGGAMAGRHHFIGDVHGMKDALDALMHALAPEAGDVVVFLGDLVDRGPDSI